MGKVNKLGQYKGIQVKVEKHIATDEEVGALLEKKAAEFGYNSPANTELHCKTILLNLSCKIKCFYRKFCRSYTTPAKFLCFTALSPWYGQQ